MELFEAIFGRRTIKDFTPAPVPDDLLERALSAGLWAQNHRVTQPWRFTVLGPGSRESLITILANTQRKPGSENDDVMRRKAEEEAKKKITSKPVIVAVSYCLSNDPQQRVEDYAATCCAIQNIQLAAWDLGLGMQWSTGKLIRDPSTYDLLQIKRDEEEIAGLLYFGYPAAVPKPYPRKKLADVMKRLP